jgi:glycosyltransferase involved in cell wall biosynthesis
MVVLHLTLTVARGGRRQAIASLVEGLRAIGTTCHVATLEDLGCDMGDLGDLGGRVAALRRRSLMDLRALCRLQSMCRTLGVNIIHAHDAASQFAGAVARLTRPWTKLLMTFHRSLNFESARWRDRMRNALCASLSGAIVAASRERQQHFLATNWVRRKKVVRIPFGVDLARFHPDRDERGFLRSELGLSPETIVVGAAGHFGEEKGIERVIASWHALGSLPFPAALVVLGTGTLAQRTALERLAAKPASAGPVLLAGFRDDLHRCFRGLDLFVHAPQLEAFGLVVVEAMASGVPVVSVEVGGVVDLVAQGLTGLLAPTRAPEAIADAARTLLLDAGRRNRMGAAARTLAEREFGLDTCARRYCTLYEDILRGELPTTDFSVEGVSSR